MFSERLEKLIQSSLQDGILTDQEKAAIIKRAKAEGEDIDEVEIYIDSLLQKRQKELNNSDVKRKANTSAMDELKKLIDAAMADGIITSKEREVITRKAAALGMDADEVDVYLDAEIQKAELAADVAKRDKIGPVCPQCGKQVPPLTLKCDCGYEFTTNHQISSVQILSEKIEKILEKPLPNDDEKRKEEIENRDQQIREIISVFPVPNSKEDIIEFLSLSLPKSRRKGGFLGSMMNRFLIVAIITIIIVVVCVIKAINAETRDAMEWPLAAMISLGGGAAGAGSLLAKNVDIETIRWNKNADVWRAKFDEVLLKGRSLRGDSEFTQQLDYYENLLSE